MRELQLFIQSSDYDRVASELGLYFGVEEFLRNKNSSDPAEFYVADIAVGVKLFHPFEDERDLDFSKYQILITFRALKQRVVMQSYLDMFEFIARYLMESISSKLNCKAMLVQDVQIKIGYCEDGKTVHLVSSR